MATLPYDVMTCIVAESDRDTQKRLRLCCQWLAREAVQHLFATIRFEMRTKDLERVISIANSTDHIANAVQVLELRQSPFLEKMDFDAEWKSQFRAIWDPGYTPPRFLTDAYSEDESGEEEEDQDPEKLELSRRCRQVFEEWEAQRAEPTLYHCLHATCPERRDGLEANEELRSGLLRRLQQACIAFEAALPNLRNLRHFFANFSRNFSWNGFTFYDGYGGLTYLSIPIQVASLAFALRALGHRNAHSSSLVSMKLSLCESDLWNLQDLDQAWVPPDARQPEVPPPLLNSQSRTLMNDAFIHLTDLDVVSEDIDDLNSTITALAQHLNAAQKLLRLTIRAFDFHPEAETELDMLNGINLTTWPMLQHLKLEKGWFTTDSLLRLLSVLAPSLQSLELQGCGLVEPQSSWPDFYARMRLLPFRQLRRLEFQNCVQRAPDLFGGSREFWSWRDAAANRLVLHFTGDGQLAGFSSAVYDYILKRTDEVPLLQPYMAENVETLRPSTRSSTFSMGFSEDVASSGAEESEVERSVFDADS